jgi:5-methyltetrahydropteroyltriglutamate--homocysteine methyltransferase
LSNTYTGVPEQQRVCRRGVETLPLPKHLLPTSVVGSYPQPDWLVDREMLSKSVPRTRMTAMWRIPDAYLEQAQDDATVVAIRDMERPVSIS